MMYRAYCRDTGEIWESDSFRNVYRCSMYSVKGYCHDSHEIGLIRITKCSDIVDWRDEEGYLHSEAIDEEPVCYIAVSDRGYTIDYGSVIMTVDKDCWSINRW